MADAAFGPATTLFVAAIEQATGKPARRQGRELVVLCPVHGDVNPSGNVREGDGGWPLWVCRSHGCTMEQVLQAVGLSWEDVLGNEDDRWTPRGPYTAVYDYVDSDGKLLFQVCRTADKQFPQRHPNPEKAKGWEWNLNGTPRVPYRLPSILTAAKVGEEIYICEGEKDVASLERLGHVATCNPGGAGKWREEYAAYFKGANVLVCADRDEVGYAHAAQVCRSLQGVATSVGVRAAKQGKDVSDHLSAGYGLEALVPLSLADLDAAASERGNGLVLVTTEQPGSEGGADEGGGAPRLRFLPGGAFRKQPLARIEPLFGSESDALMMPGSLVLLAGIGGSGKTTLALHAIAHWSAGLPWFGIATPRPIRTIVIENEGPHDPFARKVDDFVDRFVSCTCSGEPHGTASGIDENCLFLDAPWGKFTFDDKGSADELRSMVREFEADLVVANPLGRLGMKGAGTPEETRAFLDLLVYAGLGEDFAALLVHHLAKMNPQTPLVQQISGDWGPHPDTIMVMEHAGERTSKLSFGKVRWGDQGRAPLILNWLTDPEGPVGYRLHAKDEITAEQEDDLAERIDAFLETQQGAVGMTAIRTAVRGKATHIIKIVTAGVESGHYQAGGGKRQKYQLTSQIALGHDNA